MTVATTAMLNGKAPESDLPMAAESGEINISHKVILYVEGVTVSFDGFARSTIFRWPSTPVSCAA